MTNVNYCFIAAISTVCVIPIADAQSFNVYGYQGFVLQGGGPPFIQPFWVTPKYVFSLTQLGQPAGTVANSQLELNSNQKIDTPNGLFYTPVPVDVTIGGVELNVNGSPVGNYGLWLQLITNKQANFGLYFAGDPAVYAGSFTNFVDGTYGGTISGYVRKGYAMASVEGCVTVIVNNPNVSIETYFDGNIDHFTGNGKVSALGITFDGTGHASSDYVNAKGKTSDYNNYSITGGGDGLFIGNNAAGVSGLFYTTNTSGPPNGNIVFAMAFGAGKGKSGCQ
jgi:hypothetical protein